MSDIIPQGIDQSTGQQKIMSQKGGLDQLRFANGSTVVGSLGAGLNNLILQTSSGGVGIFADTSGGVAFAECGSNGFIRLIDGSGFTQFELAGNVETKLSGTQTDITIPPNWTDSGSSSSTIAQTLLITPSINYTGTSRTGHYEALVIDVTETSLPTGNNLLAAFRTGSVDRFKVSNTGNVYADTGLTGGVGNGALFVFPTNVTPSSAGLNLDLGGGAPSATNGVGGEVQIYSGPGNGTGLDGEIKFFTAPVSYTSSSVQNGLVIISTIHGVQNNLSGTNSLWTVDPTFSDSGNASSGTMRCFYIKPTVNYTAGTGSVTALQIDQVETSNPSGTNYLIRARSGITGTTDTFSVTNTGEIAQTGTNGSTLTISSTSELLTLSTSGTTTDTSANLLPANSLILSVDTRITTTITTATDWSVGDPTTATRFSSANSTMTAGTSQVGINQANGGVASGAGMMQSTAAKIRITTTGTPGAGVVRITVHYIQLGAPTS